MSIIDIFARTFVEVDRIYLTRKKALNHYIHRVTNVVCFVAMVVLSCHFFNQTFIDTKISSGGFHRFFGKTKNDDYDIVRTL